MQLYLPKSRIRVQHWPGVQHSRKREIPLVTTERPAPLRFGAGRNKRGPNAVSFRKTENLETDNVRLARRARSNITGQTTRSVAATGGRAGLQNTQNGSMLVYLGGNE